MKEYTKNMVSISSSGFKQVDYIKDWGFTPPDDYIDFMTEFIEGEGPIGENSWLTLWRVDELAEINRSNIIMEDVPEYFLFGKDAADTGYAFNKSYKTYHSFGLMSDIENDDIVYLGKNFLTFIKNLQDE